MPMSDDDTTRDTGGKHAGAPRTSPYPMSRLAPVHDLVDVAKQIATADSMLGAVASAELAQIAEQIRSLQDRAREVLAAASASLEIHRAHCAFQKRPGHVYHLYARADGTLWLSMIGPDEWRGPDPDRQPRGSYRLELDQSFTRVDVADVAPRPIVTASALVGAPALDDGSREPR